MERKHTPHANKNQGTGKNKNVTSVNSNVQKNLKTTAGLTGAVASILEGIGKGIDNKKILSWGKGMGFSAETLNAGIDIKTQFIDTNQSRTKATIKVIGHGTINIAGGVQKAGIVTLHATAVPPALATGPASPLAVSAIVVSGGGMYWATDEFENEISRQNDKWLDKNFN